MRCNLARKTVLPDRIDFSYTSLYNKDPGNHQNMFELIITG